ncbi:sugar ABC transporter ATP-binding protein [Nocardioides cavernae]|uniref:Sugar ABC transporter ATP-binding protein n=1 Tax=Nocardioides cavernae TaxID=1921566 RepID=A0ABR8NDH1_9ACTN|nr:sugar ABC transporter ATP-binding protein [Nocardioides cavernae]MBD3926184.1 sugar ABC transporter ATP-binding protein [Nocardioides cavernae]MBM7513776.1 ribose transport system ATP-binding protein [Nocardioides cavernae]
MTAPAPRLEVRGLSKTFAGVTVLEDAGLTLAPGEIHALVGQNGSGKSTLIKLVSGVHRADPGGEIRVDGELVGPPVDPGALHHQGLAFVHQDLGLVADLTVRENVRVGHSSAHRFTRAVDTAVDREAVRRTYEFLGLDIDPEARVSSLTPSERVSVAVARALQDREEGSGVIVFDESSRAIPPEALPAFYDVVRFLASHGTSVLFVSHDLKEVLGLAHRVTALRNGRVIETGVPVAELDEAALTRLVLGRDGAPADLVAEYPYRPLDGTVELRGVRGGRVRDVSATLRRGEVVGVTGTIDSGILDLPALLGGATPAHGTVTVGRLSVDLARGRVRDLLRLGVVLIPQDRHGLGLATELTVEENITIPHVRRRGRPWSLGSRWRRETTDTLLERYDVRPRNRDHVVAALSGGNQQKVLFAKWLVAEPALLTLEEPTQAVDVGARAALLEATRKAAQGGTAVLLVSSEVEDLAAVCDRLLVLEDGVVACDLTGPFTPESVLDATFTRSRATSGGPR